MVYIIETLQVASGTFMGSTTEVWHTQESARADAQAQSNIYGTITRVVRVVIYPNKPFTYTLDPEYSLTPADYFYPQPFQPE